MDRFTHSFIDRSVLMPGTHSLTLSALLCSALRSALLSKDAENLEKQSSDAEAMEVGRPLASLFNTTYTNSFLSIAAAMLYGVVGLVMGFVNKVRDSLPRL